MPLQLPRPKGSTSSLPVPEGRAAPVPPGATAPPHPLAAVHPLLAGAAFVGAGKRWGGESLPPRYAVSRSTKPECCSPRAPPLPPHLGATTRALRPIGERSYLHWGGRGPILLPPRGPMRPFRDPALFSLLGLIRWGRPFSTHLSSREARCSTAPPSRLDSRSGRRPTPEARTIPAQPILVFRQLQGCQHFTN
ncbi:hypothetical protein NDU88_004502 [Pleurodeles waltl]|uniref:Uncharacterized protein n=1 Tax=Pleurodeles waltl TaxID=8319 RepID=A0AAV7WAJ6_PLEWA|nr:hypothetical protein NDU88_004502 [Pleurodeles waltl]